MKKINTSLKIALGTTLLSGLAVSTAHADLTAVSATPSNPFQTTDLATGYMQSAPADAISEKKEGSCGEGKCGSKKEKMPKEGKCGDKMGEGKCGDKK